MCCTPGPERSARQPAASPRFFSTDSRFFSKYSPQGGQQKYTSASPIWTTGLPADTGKVEPLTKQYA
jgi:hypothetical protein